MIETSYAGAIDVPELVEIRRRGGQVFYDRSLLSSGESGIVFDGEPRRQLVTDCVWLVPTWQAPFPEPLD